MQALHSTAAKLRKSDYVRRTLPCKLKSGWTAFENSKKCFGIEWVAFFEPNWIYLNNQNYGESDIKPVVEHIEGDLKYDFRTKTHFF